MTRNDRLTHIWSLLVQSADARKVLTYAILEQLIDVPRQAVGCWLTPIQDYCNFHNLPPLTLLVVNDTHDPLIGDLADADIFGERARVYQFDWLSQKTPSPEDFQRTTNTDAGDIPWYYSWQPWHSLRQHAGGDAGLLPLKSNASLQQLESAQL
jgi:hypothetical protein